MKKCTTKTCQHIDPQPLSNFYRDSKSPDGLSNRCKSCIKKVKSKYYALNKASENQKCRDWKKKNPIMVKAANLRHNYNITIEEYNKILENQSDSCAICKCNKKDNIKYSENKVRDLAVDHCHVTGKVRGLLCYSCNLAIGMLKDNIARAKKLVKYLEEHEEKV